MFSNFAITYCAPTFASVCPVYKEIVLDWFPILSMQHKIDLVKVTRYYALSL